MRCYQKTNGTLNESEAVPTEDINGCDEKTLAILRRWNAHCSDQGSGLATLGAIFPANTLMGKIVSRLEKKRNFQWEADIASLNEKLTHLQKTPPSSAAAAMLKHARYRAPNRKTLKIELPTLLAALDYYRERRAILEEIHPVISDKHRRYLTMHLVAIVNVIDHLQETKKHIMARGV